MARLFVAIWPPDHVLDALGDLAQPRDQGVRWVDREKRHITLRFFRNADPDAIVDALDHVELPSAMAQLGPSIDVLSERSLVVPVRGIDDLAAVIGQATRGEDAPRRRFYGHLTVARLARRARPHRSVGVRFSASFDVARVALVHSDLRPNGAVYETLAEWPTA
ncbi:MAG: RNA 2',3'-cyclic phosphodiesterase [Actinomycetota bacterium]